MIVPRAIFSLSPGGPGLGFSESREISFNIQKLRAVSIGQAQRGEQRMIERRRERRTPTFELGKIVFGGNLTSIECIVWDLSAGGANVQIGSAQGLPREIFLKIPGKHMSRLGQIAWESQDRLGISFCSVSRQAGQPTTPEI